MRPFVGRTEELRALTTVCQTPVGTAAALVTGEPGSGKTRLLAEARSFVADRHYFGVAGFESEQQVPLAAAASLLRALAAVPEHGERLEALLFGSLVRRDGKALDRAAATVAPIRVLEAARRAFRAVEPALIVIDDLHWVDELSLSLCHYLIRDASEAQHKLAVFVATRPGGGGEDLLETLPQTHRVEIHLAPLTQVEGVAMARALDPWIDTTHAIALWRRAQGSPFWLEALVRHRHARGGAPEVLSSRLRGASADAAALLAALAVAGRQVPSAAAAELIGQPSDRMTAALRDLVRRGLAVAIQDGARLSHDLIRSAVLAELSDETRSRLHRAIARWLEGEDHPDIRLQREALEHRRAGGLPTLKVARKLARSPQRRLLGTAGVLQLASLADESDPSAAETIALQADVAALAHELGEDEEALARWSIVAERSRRPNFRASAMLEASRAAYAMGRRDEALALLSRCDELGAGDELLKLELKIHRAAIQLWLEKRTTEGRDAARAAVSQARRLAMGPRARPSDRNRARRAYLDALQLDYEAAMQEGDLDALLHSALEREAAASGGGLEEMLTAELAVGAALRLNGRVDEAITILRRVRAETDRAVLPHLGVDVGFWLARSQALRGELVEAEEVVRETSELVRHVGDVPRARHRLVRVACHVEIERGGVATGVPRLELETSLEANEHQRILLHADCAVWRARLDGPSAAGAVASHLAAAQACAETVACPRCDGDLQLLAAESLARLGMRAAARSALKKWDTLGRRGDQLDGIMRLHAGALAAAQAPGRASGLEEALAVAEASPFGLSALWIRLDLGLALAASGHARAAGELRRAAAAAEQRGATTVAKLAGHALRGMGVRTWRRAAAGSPLTRREHEVARMAASGATNRELAADLFLSPKTVERHLGNIFRKLNVRNRTELAAKMAEPPEEIAGIPR